MDYNRIVKDLNGMSANEFLEAIKDVFEIIETSDSEIKPKAKSYVAMYLDGV